MRRAPLLSLLVPVLVVGCTHEATPPTKAAEAQDTEDKVVTAPPSQAAQPEATQTPSGVTTAPSGVAVAPPKPLPVKVKLKVRARGLQPNEKAIVFWGKKKLGEAPLDFDRPRDSGPVDLIVRSDGYFPVHTRVYTFRNDVVWVKLTKLDDKMTLFGAKRDVNEPPPGSTPDGGVPPPAPPQ